MAKGSKKSVEEMFADITSQLTNLTPLVDSVKNLTDKVTALEKLVTDTQTENKKLLEDIAERDRTIDSLKEQLSDATQYQRQWSIRVVGLPIPDADKHNNFKVKQVLYRNLLLPILEGAAAQGDLSDVPQCDQLLERAHILPSAPNKPMTVIARFFNRDLKDLIFKHRKEYQPYEPAPVLTRAANRSAPPPRARPLFMIYEDLNRPIFTKLRALATHEDVHAAWTSAGTIRFRLKSSQETVHRVRRVYDTVEDILREAKR